MPCAQVCTCDWLNRINTDYVVDPVDAIEVALSHGVDGHEARAPMGPGSAANANRNASRTGLGNAHSLSLVAARLRSFYRCETNSMANRSQRASP